MNLGDVLHGLDDQPLKGHTWTAAIVKALNAILPSSQPLTEDSTGNAVLNELNVLDEDSRSRLLRSEVDPLNGTLTLTETVGDVDEGDLNLVNKRHNAILQAMMKDPRKTMITAMSAAFTLFVIGVVFVMLHLYLRDGKVPDTSLFEALFHATLDLYNQMNAP